MALLVWLSDCRNKLYRNRSIVSNGWLNMENENIPQTILSTISRHFKIPEAEGQKKLAELTKVFLNSDATVYCEDCGVVFYSGKADPVAREHLYVEWKYLSFRHVWDTKHKVKIYMPFFLATGKQVESKNKALASMMKEIRRHALGFDDAEQVCYYLEVEKLRDRFVQNGSYRAALSNDENWDANSTCFCSVCKKEYRNPKVACLCHKEVKPWLPLDEVETIKFRR